MKKKLGYTALMGMLPKLQLSKRILIEEVIKI